MVEQPLRSLEDSCYVGGWTGGEQQSVVEIIRLFYYHRHVPIYASPLQLTTIYKLLAFSSRVSLAFKYIKSYSNKPDLPLNTQVLLHQGRYLRHCSTEDTASPSSGSNTSALVEYASPCLCNSNMLFNTNIKTATQESQLVGHCVQFESLMNDWLCFRL